MSDEQCGADPFENGYDQKLSEKEYRERIKYLMRCHDDSADEIERLREHIAQQQLDIITLGQEVGRLREALKEIEADCSSDYPPSHGAIKYAARAALGEEKK